MSSGNRQLGSKFVSGLALITLVVGLVGSYLVLAKARSDLKSDIYRSRLEAVSQDYAALLGQFNEAVTQTAVTELVVSDGALRVRVRNRLGVEHEIDTPYDPSGEIYVDYVVIGGRLWIRRVFDAKTPPVEGVVIDPALADVDWEDPGSLVGKAVYRSLGEGVWQVSVTGQGALGLVRVDESRRQPLVEAPKVLEFEAMESQVREAVRRVSFGDLVREALGMGGRD